ncbi:MAG: DUF6390 family protein [Candidatus Pacebacteria bacterium]|jgi:hypothetical protein|nr:DUF6390 family protein [Candidatus Paceibacterota bacterium]
MDGILRCSKYAFGPNRLHYCGPDRNSEIFSYIEEKETDDGLVRLMSQFETMHPYLLHIAEANHIQDPLDDRVVEAYWIGNDLLEKIPKQKFYAHLLDGLHLKDKFGLKGFNAIAGKIDQGAVPHHSFHVFDIWRRTGHVEREHTLESMDACRISSGKIVSVNGPFIIVLTEPLLYEKGKLFLGPASEKKLVRQLESDYDIEQLKKDDIVTIHWNVICEKITKRQEENLKKYTLRHIRLANLTI